MAGHGKHIVLAINSVTIDVIGYPCKEFSNVDHMSVMMSSLNHQILKSLN